MKTLAAVILALSTIAAVAPAHAGFGPGSLSTQTGPAFGPNDITTQSGPAFGPSDITTQTGPAFGPSDIRSFEGPARYFSFSTLSDRK